MSIEPGNGTDKPAVFQAIGREARFKLWPRAQKVRLILAANPSWADLYDQFI